MNTKPGYSKEVLERLNADSDFQRLIAEDKQLADLFSLPEKTEEESELEFYAAMGGRFGFKGGYFKVVSPGVISLLSLFNSPFVCRGRKVTVESVNEAMFILCNGKSVLEMGGIAEVKQLSQGFCEVLGVEVGEACKSIFKAIKVSFLGLSYMQGIKPTDKSKDIGSEVNPFDVEWLTRQVALAHETCGYPPEVTKWELSMCELSYIACQKARKNGIFVKKPQRAELVMERLHFLMDKRIEEYEKNV